MSGFHVDENHLTSISSSSSSASRCPGLHLGEVGALRHHFTSLDIFVLDRELLKL